MQAAPTLDQFLDLLRRVTPEAYSDPYFEDPTGQIALYRGWAQTFAILSQKVERAASRQLLIPAPGFEPPSSSSRATMTVVLRRTRDLGSGLLIGTAAAQLEGPNERIYVNAETVRWLPNDPEGEKTVEFVSTVIGEPGNAEWLGDDDGFIIDESTGLPALDVTDFRDLSDDRTGTMAVLDVIAGQLSTIRDEGRIPTFREGDVGLYLRINNASNVANIGRVLRVVGYSISAVQDPPDSGLYPRTLILDDGPQAVLIYSAKLDDGGVFTDFTTQAQSPDADDVPLLPSPLAVGDAFYIGALEQFLRVDLELTQRAYGDFSLAFEIWDGAAWVAVPNLADETLEFGAAEGTRSISFAQPAAWVSVVVDGVDAFWLRARCTAVVSLTQQPLAGQIVTYYGPTLAVEATPGEVAWSILDWLDLGVAIVSMTAPAGGRDNDLGMLAVERGYFQEVGETDEDFRYRIRQLPAAVSPNEIRRGIRRILEPYGITSDVIDTQPGISKSFFGLFCDVPVSLAPDIVSACDLYGPGDLFPTNTTFLLIDDIGGAKWHFWALVPAPTLGEFGCFCDSTVPVFFVPGPDLYFDSAADYALCDGGPWLSELLYRRVAEYLDAAKMLGISWDFLIRDVDPCAV